MSTPLVSIAMTTYNGEKFLQEQIDSILNQTYENLEIIICDDFSKDLTIEILYAYAKKDKRIKFISNEKNLGFMKNFEKAISLTQGEYIALADQDDIWKPNKIAKLLEKIGSYNLIHSDMDLIDENSTILTKLWKKPNIKNQSFAKSIFGNDVTGCTVLFKKTLLKHFFPIPSGEIYHDWWLALLASKENSIEYIDEKLVYYRQHTQQDTGATIETKKDKISRLLKNYIQKKSSYRYQKSLNQLKRLHSFLEEKEALFSQKEKEIILEAILYYDDYINNFFHFQTFKIGLKYSKEIHIDNPFFIKSFIIDLVG